MQDNIAKTAAEWVLVARSVTQLPDSQDKALHCMARAGVAAQDAADWLAVAKVWAEDFGNMEMARQCMFKAESIAESSVDWKILADAWTELENYERASDCRVKLLSTETHIARYDLVSLPAVYEVDIDDFSMILILIFSTCYTQIVKI